MRSPASSARSSLPRIGSREYTPRAASRQRPAGACRTARCAHIPPKRAPDVYASRTPDPGGRFMEQIRKGMVAHSSDGEKLGKVVAVHTDSFIVEKGFFFPVDYTCRFDDISEVRGDEDVILRLAKAELEQGFAGEERGSSEEARGISGREGIASSGTRDVNIPVSEEQLQVEKRKRKTGEVRVSKNVVTEEKQVTVPVTREEVRVERVPAGRPASGSDARFANEK